MTESTSGILHILSPGLATLVVDFGRPRCRSLGVAVGGAADRRALAIGNGLVGNRPDAAALEICLAGPTLTATCPLAAVVYGAPFQLATDRRRLVAGRTFTLKAGEQLRIGGTPRGARAYLCVGGGLQVPEVLGSRSGFAPLKAGDELPCVAGTIGTRFLSPEVDETATSPLAPFRGRGVGGEGVSTLRVLDGGQSDWFRGDEFFTAEFRVSTESNRMGLRLRGEPLTLPARELVSEPVCPGSVQVTRDGQCIVLGVDGQTIGGYPKVAQVVAADVDRLGQFRPGDMVRFRRIDIDEAESLYRQRVQTLDQWLTRLQVAERLGGTT